MTMGKSLGTKAKQHSSGFQQGLKQVVYYWASLSAIYFGIRSQPLATIVIGKPLGSEIATLIENTLLDKSRASLAANIVLTYNESWTSAFPEMF